MSKTSWRGLVLDDDPWMGELLKVRLEAALPGLELTVRTEPDCSGEFDLFLVDNRFGDLALAAELVREIRRHSPDVLVVVFSARLSREDLLQLVSADCDLVFEKDKPGTLEDAIVDIRRCLRERHAPGEVRRGFTTTVRALADLVYQLNRSTRRLPATEGER